MSKTQTPTWIIFWLAVSAILCTYDFSFLLLRPESLPGGKYYNIFSGCKKTKKKKFLTNFLIIDDLYVKGDPKYLDMKDPYLMGIVVMNIFEVVLSLFAVLTVTLFF